MHKKRYPIFPDVEKALQKYLGTEKEIWITDRKWGKRKVIPKSIVNDLLSGKQLSCHVLQVEKFGDHGNRMDTIPLGDILNIQE